MARKAASTRKRTKARNRRSAPPALPVPARGERLWLLKLPWATPLTNLPAGITYYKPLSCHIWCGAELPAALRPYATRQHTYMRWLEDTLNNDNLPTVPGVGMKPRPEQVSDARAAVVAHAKGYRSFYIGSATGTGKTLVAVLAAKAIARMKGTSTILITVDRPAASTIPSWTATIASLGDDGYRWVVMSSDSLHKLFKRSAPSLRPGVVIADEAHVYRHLDAQRTKRFRRIAKLDVNPGPHTPFMLALTATPGHHPGEMTYLSPLFAQAAGEPASQWYPLAAALANRGMPLEKAFGTWRWEESATPRQKVAAMGKARDMLLKNDPPLMAARQPEWGRAPLDVQLVTLSPEQRRTYELEWGEFQREMRLARKGNDVPRGLAALVRLRQKAAMIRAGHTVDIALQDLENGYQVLIATEMVSTAAEPVSAALAEAGVAVARIYGQDTDVEHERLRFQRGQAPVVVFNTATSINLHANQLLEDGSKATSTPRRGYFHQPRYSGLLATQTMGRAHRDFQVCPWSILAAEDTVEQRAGNIMLSGMISASEATGGDSAGLFSVASIFDADWIPASQSADALT